MKKALPIAALLIWGCFSYTCSAQDVVSAVEGTAKTVDSTGKTIVVETADGADHTLHLADRTVVHGVNASDRAAKDSFRGITSGTKVVAHYTEQGGQDTAEEIDRVGHDGLKASTGTITRLDRGGKMLVIKTGDGAENTFHLTDHAAVDGGKDIAQGSEKSAKVTVYYTERGGQKIAHFFEGGV